MNKRLLYSVGDPNRYTPWDNKSARIYTKDHRKAYMLIEKQALHGNLYRKIRGLFHDLDKLIMYYFLPIQKAHKIHKKYSRHHNPRSFNDYVDECIDCQCAYLTKPDKPLSAREWFKKSKTKKEYEEIYSPILTYLGF